MTPEQMEELAKWHEQRAKCSGNCADKHWFIEASASHAQSAAIIRWAAKVLETEPVGVINLGGTDENDELDENDVDFDHVAVERLQTASVNAGFVFGQSVHLIVKPTFGDDNDQHSG